MEDLRVAGHRARDLGTRLPVAATHIGSGAEPHVGRQGIAFDDRVDAVARVPGVEIDVEEAKRPAERPVEDLLDAPRRMFLAEEAPAGVALDLLDRERRLIERRIRQARFPAVKSLDSFDFAAIPSLNKLLVLELARCSYVARRENVIALVNGEPASYCRVSGI